MRKVASVKVLDGFRLALTFNDGMAGEVDLSDLSGKGVFAAWLDRRYFENVKIGSSGELLWGDQLDLCPDALYLRLTGEKPEDLFPALRQEPARA
jgi:hypothetical protein